MTPGFLSPARRRDRHWQSFCLHRQSGCLFSSGRLPGEKTSASALPQDFSANTPRLLVLPVTGVLLIAAAGLADLYEGFGLGNLIGQFLAAAGPDHIAVSTAVTSALGLSPTAQKLLGVLSLGSAAALFPTISACRRGGAFQGASLLLIPPVALVIRLVAAYRLDSVNPALSAYYVELLALVFLTLGFYRLSSFAFHAGQLRLYAFYTGAAVVLSMAALADGGPYLSSLLLYAGRSVGADGLFAAAAGLSGSIHPPRGAPGFDIPIITHSLKK